MNADEAVKSVERMVFREANRFKRLHMHTDIDDLIQEGRIGAFIAWGKWKPEVGAWTTYSTYWIRQRMGKYAQRARPGIEGVVWNRKYKGQEHKKPKHPDVSSLDVVAYETIGTTEEGFEAVEDAIERESQARLARHILQECLNDKQRHAFVRYKARETGISYNDPDRVTLDSVGAEMGISRERVRQLVKQAENHIAAHIDSHGYHTDATNPRTNVN